MTRNNRSGIIFITAMWVIIVLGAMLLIFARSMRVEVVASANRLSTEQASTIELGAEQYVLSAVDACNGDAVSVLQTPAEQIQIGDGYFWIMQTDYDDDNTYAFGITDECSKLNLNVATSNALSQLPGMTQDVADSIVNWRGGVGASSGQGADSNYYQTQPRPYSAKSGPFETVEELYLVKDFTDTLLWGSDLDHNGMIDQNEQSAGGLASAFNSANDSGRGIFPFVTVWGIEPNTDANGKKRLNLNLLGTTGAATGPLRSVLTKAGFSPAQMASVFRALLAGRGGTGSRFTSLFDFAQKANITKSSDLAKIADLVTISPATTLPGLVNVNTASQQVLMCLGLSQEDATTIVSQRAGRGGSGMSGLGGGTGLGGGLGGTTSAGSTSSTDSTDYTWIMDALSLSKLARNPIGAMITGRSFFYSADIVSVSGEGRAFKRVRIVLDARNSPPAIVYRKDLTYLGWPLAPEILTALKAGQPLPAASGSGTGGVNGLPQ